MQYSENLAALLKLDTVKTDPNLNAAAGAAIRTSALVIPRANTERLLNVIDEQSCVMFHAGAIGSREYNLNLLLNRNATISLAAMDRIADIVQPPGASAAHDSQEAPAVNLPNPVADTAGQTGAQTDTTKKTTGASQTGQQKAATGATAGSQQSPATDGQSPGSATETSGRIKVANELLQGLFALKCSGLAGMQKTACEEKVKTSDAGLAATAAVASGTKGQTGDPPPSSAGSGQASQAGQTEKSKQTGQTAAGQAAQSGSQQSAGGAETQDPPTKPVAPMSTEEASVRKEAIDQIVALAKMGMTIDVPGITCLLDEGDNSYNIEERRKSCAAATSADAETNPTGIKVRPDLAKVLTGMRLYVQVSNETQRNDGAALVSTIRQVLGQALAVGDIDVVRGPPVLQLRYYRGSGTPDPQLAGANAVASALQSAFPGSPRIEVVNWSLNAKPPSRPGLLELWIPDGQKINPKAVTAK